MFDNLNSIERKALHDLKNDDRTIIKGADKGSDKGSYLRYK